MSYTKLIAVMENLPPAQQAQIFDFAKFLAMRCDIVKSSPAISGIVFSSLADLLTHPLEVKAGFRVIKREELYDRACLR